MSVCPAVKVHSIILNGPNLIVIVDVDSFTVSYFPSDTFENNAELLFPQTLPRIHPQENTASNVFLKKTIQTTLRSGQIGRIVVEALWAYQTSIRKAIFQTW